MKKVNIIFKDKNGKKLWNIEYPVSPISSIKKNSMLTNEQKRRLEILIKESVKETSHHFNKDGAWDIDAKFLVHEIVDTFLGFDLHAMIMGEICHKTGTCYTSDNKGHYVYRNEKKKAFYNPEKNKIYVDTKCKKVEDIQLGDL